MVLRHARERAEKHSKVTDNEHVLTHQRMRRPQVFDALEQTSKQLQNVDVVDDTFCVLPSLRVPISYTSLNLRSSSSTGHRGLLTLRREQANTVSGTFQESEESQAEEDERTICMMVLRLSAGRASICS